MTVERRTPALDRMLAFVRGLGSEYELRITNLGDLNALKLAMLTETGRPFTKVNQAARAAVTAALRTAIAAGKQMSETGIGNAAGEAFRAVVVERFETQSGVELDALNSDYKRWKARAGLDTRIGIATGNLLRALKRARFRFVRA